MSGRVRIATASGRISKDASIIGPFAIHQTYDRFVSLPTFTLTHRKSGRAIGRYWPTEEEALNAAEKLRGLTDWSRIQKPGDVPKPVMRKMQRICPKAYR